MADLAITSDCAELKRGAVDNNPTRVLTKFVVIMVERTNRREKG